MNGNLVRPLMAMGMGVVEREWLCIRMRRGRGEKQGCW